MAVKGKNSLFFGTGIDTSGLLAGKADAISIVSSLGTAIGKINPFAALAVGAITVFATIANEAFQFAKRYEQAMLEVRTISKAANTDFRGIGNDIFQLSKDTLDDPIALAQAYYQVVSAGYDGAEGLRVLEVASKAATAGVTTTQTAADGITTVLNAFSISAERADEVSDSMFKTVELGKTNFEQLSRSLSQAAPLASSLGVSYNEVLAAVASLTKQGVPTAQAMTQIRAALIGVNRTLGDGWAEANTFQEAMEKVYQGAGGSVSILEKQLGSIEAVGALLATTGDNAAGAAKDLYDLENAAGSAAKAFDIMASGQINQMQILKNRIRAVTEGLGNDLLEVANKVAGFFVDITDGSNFSAALYQKERTELSNLRGELESVTTSEERKIEIIDTLKSKYPAFLENIKNEGKFTDELRVAIVGVNEQLRQRFLLAGNSERLGEVSVKMVELENEQRKATIELQQELGRITNADAKKIVKTYKERERSELDQVNALKKYSTSQFRYLDQYTAAIRKPGKELVELRKEFAKLTGQQENLQGGLVEFDSPKKTNENDAVIEDTGAAQKTYKEYLEDKAKQYKAYEAVRVQIGEEAAQEQFKSLLEEGDSYKQFLQFQLAETKDFAKQQQIALQADTNRFKLKNETAEKVTGLEVLSDREKIVVPLEFDLDQESINDVTENIAKATTALGETTNQSVRDQLRVYIDAQNKKLDAMRGVYTDEEEQLKRLQEIVEGYSLRELSIRVRDARALYKEKKRLGQAETKEGLAALSDLRDAQQKFSDGINEIGSGVADALGGIGDIFAEFGNDEMAELLGQMAEVTQAATQLGAGIASGDPLAIINGAINLAKAAISVEIVSDTAKFEKAIKRLQESIEQLDYAIAQSIGDERIANRKDAIDQLKELELQAQKAKEAEEKARKEVKLLGLRVGDKGEGSGTDPEKIKEIEDQAEEARRRVEELNNEIDQLFTGTTRDSIVDSIVSGFEEGKNSIADFAGTFEELMRNAVLESLKLKYLEGAVEEFFKSFANEAEDDGGLDAQEIQSLRNKFNTIIAQSQEEFDALNEILGEAGIASSSALERQGLSGNIETVTEQTANVLAGAINGIRIDVSQGLAAAREANFYLNSIMLTNISISELMEVQNNRLLNIEKLLA